MNTHFTMESSASLIQTKNNIIDFTNDIVIIDDDMDDRNEISRMFQKISFEHNLRCFKDGDDFLNTVQIQEMFWEDDQTLGLPKVIFVDMHMPYKDGIETITEIRSNSIWADIPIILVTSTTDDERIERAYELGANAFLSKPFKQIDLIQAIRQAITISI